jgi:PAS domain S-box-containing protein
MSKPKTQASDTESFASHARWRDHDHHPHVVQFYEDDWSLLGALSRFIGTALGAGDAAVVIATETHREGLAQRLAERGLDMARAVKRGRYVSIDAADTLSKITLNGSPDAGRFADIIGGTIARAKAAAEDQNPSVVIFGEMVALLWAEGKSEATIRLEQLWNDLAQTHSFSLRCGYPMKGFYREEHGESFLKICLEHTGVIPEESYTALTCEDDRVRNIALLQQQAYALKFERSLRQSQELFRLMVEAVQDYAIFLLDPEGRVTSWNRGAERIKGYKTSEILGKHFSCFYPEEDLRSGEPLRELDIAAKEGRFEAEGWRVRKDGSRFWANVIITAIKDADGHIIGFGKVIRDFTERRQAEEARRELSSRLLRAQDEQRQKISCDLHDVTGALFSGILMNLAILQKDAARLSEKGRTALAECDDLARQCVREIRTLSYLLHPPLLTEAGLVPALQWLLNGFSERSGIQATLEAPPQLGRLASDIELSLFRIVQESLTNIHRHTKSSMATIRIYLEEGLLKVEVIDNGGGFAPGFREGLGVKGMKERLKYLGGGLEITNCETGCRVRATAPLKDREDSIGLAGDGRTRTEGNLLQDASSPSTSLGLKKFRILLVDDHEIVRKGITKILEDEHDFEICGEALNGKNAVDEAERLKPDIIIMDLRMPGIDGLEATRRILKVHPEIAILILTVDESRQMMLEVSKTGARGYMMKADAGSNLMARLRSLVRPDSASAASND